MTELRSPTRTGIFPVLFFVLVASVLGPGRARAQFIVRSWLPWRTIETEHFAFHYPVELEAWTRAVATHAEAIDSAVSHIVGYMPPHKTQVVVDDPYQTPNGSAWPFLDRPIINLWASPPSPRDDVGEFTTWGETLISHEFAHIAHLTRPSRNQQMRRLWSALPVDLGPLALRTPRWAFEGYATYIEGRVTGSGRPHGVWRPAFLRQWALEGQLPRYDQLNTWGAYAGGEFAYLAGSAFLEWLAQRQGDSSLVHLWRRLSAKQNRGFDEAFTGVFGESPQALYGRFSVELTAKSIDAARLIRAAGAGDTGTIEQRLAWTTGDPAVSPDGQRIALVIRSSTRPSRVVIWRTAREPDTARVRRDSLLRQSDPEDVPSRSIYPPPKKEIATLRSSGGAPYEGPRFLRDGRVLLWRYTPRGDGSLVTDLYIWDPERHSVDRVTHDASVRDADPSPDGRSAFAMRCVRGWCDLVSVDLEDGSVTTLAEGSPSRSFYRPRTRPGGGDVLVSVHDDDRWRIAIYEGAPRRLTMIDPADEANRYDGAWVTGTVIVDITERGGVPNLEMLTLGALDKPLPVTRVSGAAVAPEPSAAGGIWFLSLYSRGYDLRRIDPIAPPNYSVAELPPVLSPAAQSPGNPVHFPTNAVCAPRPFGFGPWLFRWIPQPAVDADGVAALLGLVKRDVIGRSEALLNLSFGDRAAWRGVSASTIWRGTRPAIRAEGFVASQDLTASRSPVPLRSGVDVRLAGFAASIDDTRQFDAWGLRYRVGTTVGQARSFASSAVTNDSSGSRTLLFGDGGVAWTQRGDLASFSESVGGNVTVGRSFDARFYRNLATVSLGVGGPGVPSLSANALYGRTNDDAAPFEQFTLGGGPSALVDRLLLTQRIAMPALPTAISVGSSVFAYRAALNVQPFSWYLWSGSTARAGEPFTAWHRVIGVEWITAVPPITSAGTPAARAQVGLGESLDAPFRKRLRVYASLVLNP